jgi:hypothetical protein
MAELADIPKGAKAVAVEDDPYFSGRGDLTADLLEYTEVTEMRWPKSIESIDKMRRDAQVTSVFMGLTVPIWEYPWAINPNGAEDEVVERFADDISLRIMGQSEIDAPVGRTRNRFNFEDHLRHTLLALLYGHMFFEQQGYIEEDGETDNLRWRLKKLFPIMPRTIGKIEIKRDGGLVGIRQNIGARRGVLWEPPLIRVGQLVGYIWGMEGANWLGRSLLVPVHKHWLLKDRELRIDAIKHERTGAGVPIIEAAPGATSSELARLDVMAQRYKVGEASGGAIPAGTKFRLQGVEGATSDVLASIRYQDEQIAQAFFMEVKTLGQSAYGSRALGETFAGMASPIQRAIAKWVTRTFNEHVAEDWVDINFGGDYGCPLLTHRDPREEDPALVDPDAKKAQDLLDATDEIDNLSNTEVAAGTFVMNLPESEREALRSARAHARAVIDRTPAHRRPRPHSRV